MVKVPHEVVDLQEAPTSDEDHFYHDPNAVGVFDLTKEAKKLISHY